MDQELDYQELTGTVETVIFKNEENGYTILRLRSDSGETVTMLGCFPFAAPGESVIASGKWVNHSVHGRQFKAEYAQRFLPSSAPALPLSRVSAQPKPSRSPRIFVSRQGFGC